MRSETVIQSMHPLHVGTGWGKSGGVGWAEHSDAQQTLPAGENVGVPGVTPTYESYQSDKREAAIKKNLAGLGYEF